jgi:hypothetical protein
MLSRKSDWHVPADSNDWDREKVEAGARLFSLVLTEVGEAIDTAIAQAADVIRLHTSQEIGGIVAHALFETALRQILVVRMPVTISEFEKAAGQVFKASCHHHDEGTGDDHLH